MKDKAICTIITRDFLPYALALNKSLMTYGNVELYVFIADSESNEKIDTTENIHLLYIDQVCREGIGKSIFEKYYDTDIDRFRWSSKTVLMNYLFDTGYDNVIYLDPDICFFNSYEFLFDELNDNNIILTPHWRSTDPFENQYQFIDHCNDGLFNAGFIGANKNASKDLEKISKMCLWECTIDHERGLHDDQRYLDFLIIISEKTKIIRHKGCNVGAWNTVLNKRLLNHEEVLIDNTFQIIFIHFTKSTLKEILFGADEILYPHLQSYISDLNLFKTTPLSIDELKASLVTPKKKESFINTLIQKLKGKIGI